MSKKTLIFSIVLIVLSTYFGSELFKDDLAGGPATTIQTQSIAEMATETEQTWIISSYDDLIRRVSLEEGQDWLLMSAIAYSESRFREDAISKQGAVGLMQVMPIVAREFNVAQDRIADPETNVRLASRLLRQIDKRLKFSQSIPTNDRISIILACYNGGIGHVLDARRLATSNGENPDSWEVVARYLKMKADPAICENEMVRYGQFRGGNRTVAYVREVLNRYDIYRAMVEDDGMMFAQVK